LHSQAVRLRHLGPLLRIRDERLLLADLRKNIIAAGDSMWGGLNKRLEAALIMLDTLSPFAVLRRGYSLAKLLPEGVILKDTESLTVGRTVDVTLGGGGFQAMVTEINRGEVRWPGKSLKKH
jgi:exodeoxyribonuclease VII large subunit